MKYLNIDEPTLKEYMYDQKQLLIPSHTTEQFQKVLKNDGVAITINKKSYKTINASKLFKINPECSKRISDYIVIYEPIKNHVDLVKNSLLNQ